MPKYTFACEKCNIYFQVSGTMESPPQPENHSCPECGDEVYRSFQQDMPGMIFVGMDFYVNQERARQYQINGMDKNTADKFLGDSITNSKKRMKEDPGHYTKMYMDPDEAVKRGIAKVSGDNEKADAKQAAHKKILETGRKATGKE